MIKDYREEIGKGFFLIVETLDEMEIDIKHARIYPEDVSFEESANVDRIIAGIREILDTNLELFLTMIPEE